MDIQVNSLAPGRHWCHIKTALFNLVLLIGIFTSSIFYALRWMPWDLTEDKSAWVQVIALCRHAATRCLSQCWASSMSPYDVTRSQWVNLNEFYYFSHGPDHVQMLAKSKSRMFYFRYLQSAARLLPISGANSIHRIWIYVCKLWLSDCQLHLRYCLYTPITP